MVLEHTNDPANTQRPSSSRSSSPRPASTPRSSRTTRPRSSPPRSAGNFSIMLWRNHPGDDPDAQYYWWNTGSTLNFGKFKDPTLQGLIDQGRTETDPAKRKQIYIDVNKRFASQVYNVWAYYADWVVGRQEDGAGSHGSAAPRRWRQAAVLLYGTPTLARSVRDRSRPPSIGGRMRMRRSAVSSSWSSSCRRCSLFAPAPAVPGRRRRRGAALRHQGAEGAVPGRQRARQAVLRAVRHLARQPRPGRLRQGLPVEHPGGRQAADRAAGVAAADALRAAHGARGRDPPRRVHRVPRRHQVGPLHQRGRVRPARAARASCSRSRSPTGSA